MKIKLIKLIMKQEKVRKDKQSGALQYCKDVGVLYFK